MHQALTVSGSSMIATLHSQLAVAGYFCIATVTRRPVIVATRSAMRGSSTSLSSLSNWSTVLMYAFFDSTIAASREINISCLRPVGLVVQAATRLTARTTNRILFIVGGAPEVI